MTLADQMPLTNATFDDPTTETDSVLRHLDSWEVALQAVSRLAVVFALSLALILILGHQLGTLPLGH